MQGWLSEMQKLRSAVVRGSTWKENLFASRAAIPKHRPRQYCIWSKIVK